MAWTWRDLPNHVPNGIWDAFVVMPNRVHGTLIITSPPCRGGVRTRPYETRIHENRIQGTRPYSSVRSHQGDMADIQKDYGWCRDFSASSLGGAMCGVSSLWRLDKEVGGALVPNSMQRVSKCKLVGFCGAAAR